MSTSFAVFNPAGPTNRDLCLKVIDILARNSAGSCVGIVETEEDLTDSKTPVDLVDGAYFTASSVQARGKTIPLYTTDATPEYLPSILEMRNEAGEARRRFDVAIVVSPRSIVGTEIFRSGEIALAIQAYLEGHFVLSISFQDPKRLGDSLQQLPELFDEAFERKGLLNLTFPAECKRTFKIVEKLGYITPAGYIIENKGRINQKTLKLGITKFEKQRMGMEASTDSAAIRGGAPAVTRLHTMLKLPQVR